jgi:hypothetical protein
VRAVPACDEDLGDDAVEALFWLWQMVSGQLQFFWVFFFFFFFFFFFPPSFSIFGAGC